MFGVIVNDVELVVAPSDNATVYEPLGFCGTDRDVETVPVAEVVPEAVNVPANVIVKAVLFE
jgi:hypothetical protein